MDENPQDLLPFYALGVLSPDERSAVEAYVAAHPEVQAELSQMQKDTSALPFAADPVEPPQALKQQLMGRVRADAASRRTTVQPEPSKAGRGRAWGWLMPALSMASLVVALAAVIWAIALRGQVTRLEAQTAVLEHELNSQRTVLAQLTSPSAQAFAVSGTQLEPGARGQFIADASTGSAVLVVSGLKELPPDSTYEFWLIQGKTAVAAGLFNADTQGHAILNVPHTEGLSSFTAVGVSIEPAGGSQKPSQNIVMLGKVY
jgi:anti-sigma-K factor RskA